MRPNPAIDRVVLLVLDGLRADAAARLSLSVVSRLAAGGAYSFGARTVLPSVTAAALTSILTGVPPSTHGIDGTRFAIPKELQRLRPLPTLLSRSGLPTSVLAASIPTVYRWLSKRLTMAVGGGEAHFHGDGCDDVIRLAVRQLNRQPNGLILIHWPDADRAGHEHGWASEEYVEAARRMDSRLGDLVASIEARSAETLLIVCSDHGGGGSNPRDHASYHPDDTTIPIVLTGRSVTQGPLGPGVSLLDLPPTVLWALGVQIPATYAGRPLTEAFGRDSAAA